MSVDLAGHSVGPHGFRYAAVREMAIRAAREGWLGRLAQEVGLAHLIERVVDDEDAVRLAIWRAHHVRAVRAASPLALDLLRQYDVDADEVAWSLGPNGDWRPWICGRRPLCATAMAPRWKGRLPPKPRAGHDRRAFLYGGLVLRGWAHPKGGLGLRLSPYGLEVGARLGGGAHLRTLGQMVTLTLDAPETLRASAVGRRMDEIFDHPVLAGRRYAIVRSGDYEGDVPPSGDGPPWRIAFRAKRIAWRVPWADGHQDGGATWTRF